MSEGYLQGLPAPWNFTGKELMRWQVEGAARPGH